MIFVRPKDSKEKCVTCKHWLNRHTTWADGRPGIVCTVDNCSGWTQCELPVQVHPPSICAGGWICEQHPDRPWPHEECGGPGMIRLKG